MVKSILQATLPDMRIEGRFAENIEELAPFSATNCDLVVLKAHPEKSLLSLIELLKPPVILSVRDPRDCVASWTEMLGDEFRVFQPRLMKTCVAALRLVNQEYTYTIRYEEKATTSVRAVLAIAAHLDLNISEARAKTLLRDLSPDAVKQQITRMVAAGRIDPGKRLVSDAETLWLPAHIGDGRTGKYQEALSTEQLRSINCWSRAYCESFGYEIPAALPIARGQGRLLFGNSSDALPYLRAGFSYPEEGFTWTDGDEAFVALPLSQCITGNVACEFHYFKPRPQSAPPVRIVVMLLCGSAVLCSAIDSADAPTIRLATDDPRLYGTRELVFRIAVINPYCPKAHNDSHDERQLGLALQAISLSY